MTHRGFPPNSLHTLILFSSAQAAEPSAYPSSPPSTRWAEEEVRLDDLLESWSDPGAAGPTVTIPPTFWRRVEEERRYRDEVLQPRAQAALEELLRTPAPLRRDRYEALTETDPEGVRNPVLVSALLERSRRRLSGDPLAAADLAALAAVVAAGLPPRFGASLRQDLMIRSCALEADALRAQGDLAGAHRTMNRALTALMSSAEPILRAEVVALAAALRRDQGRFAEAEALLDRAILIARDIRDDTQAAAYLRRRAELSSLQGRQPEASVLHRQATDWEKEGVLQAC